MIDVRIEDKPLFRVVGKSRWISGQDNQQFSAFWTDAHESGLVEKLRRLTGDVPGAMTKGYAMGISCVEKDPNDRAFNFLIATETAGIDEIDDLEIFIVPASKWAIFSNRGDLPRALIDAEMYAFMEWLPSSPYNHSNAPEIEVYPAHDRNLVEFWLPIVRK